MAFNYPWVLREITLKGNGYRRGDNEPGVRKVQEWLCLNGFRVGVDGDFGPATQRAVGEFQAKHLESSNGIVDQPTFAALTAPMQRVISPLSPAPLLGALMVQYAQQHLAEHPLEVGGQNRGPWVRLYMKGNEGKDWPWCAGFACFVMGQAAETLNVPPPIKSDFGCDTLAIRAKAAGCFISGLHLSDPVNQLTPGSLFLHRKTSTDWTHTGIVTAVHAESFDTIEGNTNDNGDREGFEVCRRVRGYKNMDFIRIA